MSRKKRLNESLDCPCEGIFWVIGDELIAFTEQTDTLGKHSTTLEHRKIWSEIWSKYTLDGKPVLFDYFPRGRVMVNPVYKDDKFDHYNAYIYIDDCINDDEIISDLIYTFRLNKNCDIKYIGSEGGVESDHYRCHLCK